MGGFFFDVEEVRTESRDRDAPRRPEDQQSLMAQTGAVKRQACAEHCGLSTRSERPQNKKRNHPRPPLLETTRVDGVKAPLHNGTPRSCLRVAAVAAPAWGRSVEEDLVALVV